MKKKEKVLAPEIVVEKPSTSGSTLPVFPVNTGSVKETWTHTSEYLTEHIVHTHEGHVYTARVYGAGNFTECTHFDAKSSDRQTRQELACAMRRRENISQAEIASRLGVSQPTVSNYLRKGTGKPNS